MKSPFLHTWREKSSLPSFVYVLFSLICLHVYVLFSLICLHENLICAVQSELPPSGSDTEKLSELLVLTIFVSAWPLLQFDAVSASISSPPCCSAFLPSCLSSECPSTAR